MLWLFPPFVFSAADTPIIICVTIAPTHSANCTAIALQKCNAVYLCCITVKKPTNGTTLQISAMHFFLIIIFAFISILTHLTHSFLPGGDVITDLHGLEVLNSVQRVHSCLGGGSRIFHPEKPQRGRSKP